VPDQWSTRRGLLIFLGGLFVLLLFAHLLQIAGFLAMGRPIAWNRILASFLTWFGRGAVVGLVAAVSLNMREWSNVVKTLVGIAVVPGAAVLHTLFTTIRFSVGVGHSNETLLTYLMSSAWVRGLTVNGIVIATGILVSVGAREHEERLRKESAAIELAGRLSEMRLQILRLQLRPHFLFNSLNTIAALAEDQPERAAEITRRLRKIFQASLEQDEAQLVTLEEDLSLALDYLEIQKTRFRERLTIRTRVDQAALPLAVPHFMLQPLVENAVQHGLGHTLGNVWIEVRAAVEGEALRVEVEDNGAGPGDVPIYGVGLGNTRQRLEHLFGDAASLRTGRSTSGGFLVSVTIPLSGSISR
jgi:two-component system, LytTR family, sensor kinase